MATRTYWFVTVIVLAWQCTRKDQDFRGITEGVAISVCRPYSGQTLACET